MKALTYSNRSNARRAALQAGLDRDKVEITVHKLGDEIRFGWREYIAIAENVMTTVGVLNVSLPTKRSEINGVKRPLSGGVCAAIWEWLDKNPHATLSDIKKIGLAVGWNKNTVTRQFYERRHFNGID